MDPTPWIKCFCDAVKCLWGPVQEILNEASAYVVNCRRNVDLLKEQMDALIVKRIDIEKEMDRAKRKDKEPTEDLKQWLIKVIALETKAKEIRDAYDKRSTCAGDISLDVCTVYQLGKSACEKLEEAKGLTDKTFMEKFRESGPDSIVERLEGSGTGMGLEFKQLQEYVTDNNVRIIGVYGMGGVGKSNLVQKVGSELPKDLENVIWIDMSGRPNVEEIQKIISDELQLPEQKDPTSKIFKYLNANNFVLILDNLWEPVDLKKIGIPAYKTKSKSKVILTTRIESVCDKMGAKKIKVKCLGWKDAWTLFEEKAGKELVSNRKINSNAEKLAKKCGGLPLALITVGSTMASKSDPKQWKHALDALADAPWQIEGMEEKVLSPLKDSYDNLANNNSQANLANNNMQTCLLYCSLYPEEFSIYKDWITDYCVGEGIIDNQNVENIYNRGCEILGILKAASLLEDGDNEDYIKMHPMVRAMALWIACECGKKEGKWLVKAGTEAKAADIERWREAERVSLMRNKISRLTEAPHCLSLLTLMLQRNSALKVICDDFFQYMPILRVLDLSHTSIVKLPSSIEVLVELQYLDLCGTLITELPKELGALAKLRFLLLSHTRNLRTIPYGVIANLTKLQVFYIHYSYGDWKVGSTGEGVDFKELINLKQLKALGITISTISAFEKLERSHNSIQVAKSTRRLQIKGCLGLTSISSETLGNNHKALDWLHISDAKDLEELVFSGGDGEDNDNEWSTLPNLETLMLLRLRKATIIFERGCLQNLRTLFIWNCIGIEQLIHWDEEIADEDREEVSESIEVLPSLENMQLGFLPNLKSLGGRRSALIMPSLKTIRVFECPKLKKLVGFSESLTEIQGQTQWWDELEWENDSVKTKFLPLFKKLKL